LILKQIILKWQASSPDLNTTSAFAKAPADKVFISYRQKNEGERGRLGDEGTKRLRDEETRQCYLGVNSV
jgi:hypothetical protein